MEAPLSPAEAAPQPANARTGAGVALIAATLGAGVGLAIGGPVGAGAGLLLTGAARNTIRATRYWADPDPALRRDAGTSAGLALLGGVVGAGLAFYVYREKKAGE